MSDEYRDLVGFVVEKDFPVADPAHDGFQLLVVVENRIQMT